MNNVLPLGIILNSMIMRTLLSALTVRSYTSGHSLTLLTEGLPMSLQPGLGQPDVLSQASLQSMQHVSGLRCLTL